MSDDKPGDAFGCEVSLSGDGAKRGGVGERAGLCWDETHSGDGSKTTRAAMPVGEDAEMWYVLCCPKRKICWV